MVLWFKQAKTTSFFSSYLNEMTLESRKCLQHGQTKTALEEEATQCTQKILAENQLLFKLA
jgi:hypothetical protein